MPLKIKIAKIYPPLNNLLQYKNLSDLLFHIKQAIIKFKFNRSTACNTLLTTNQASALLVVRKTYSDSSGAFLQRTYN